MCFDRRLLGAAALAAAALATSACTPVDVGFGEALKYDMAVQTIDPDPVYDADDAKPGDNGDKGADAVKRYRTDAVKPVETMTTTTSTTGSGSGSGAGPR